MKFSVKRSFVRANPGFEAQVAAHAKELRDWLDREDRVAKQGPNVPEIDRWVSCLRPMAPSYLVESAVNEKGEADYDVENDDPTPEALLPAKKAALVDQLRRAEAAAHDANWPVMKRPLLNFTVAEAREKETALRETVVAENSEKIVASIDEHNDAVKKVNDKIGALAKISAKMGFSELPEQPVYVQPELADFDAEARRRMDEEDAKALDAAAKVAAADAALSRAVAQALSDIHDLTVDDVDSYQIPDLTRG